MEWIQWILRVILIPFMMLMWVSLNKKIDKNMNKELCEEKHNTLKTRLDRDDDKFDKIDKKLDDIKETLIKLDTTIKLNRN